MTVGKQYKNAKTNYKKNHVTLQNQTLAVVQNGMIAQNITLSISPDLLRIWFMCGYVSENTIYNHVFVFLYHHLSSSF